jgi:hypothetical protein
MIPVRTVKIHPLVDPDVVEQVALAAGAISETKASAKVTLVKPRSAKNRKKAVRAVRRKKTLESAMPKGSGKAPVILRIK